MPDRQDRPFTIALLAERQEDHDLVAALLSQFPRSRFEIDVFSTEAAAREAVAASRHDAYLVDARMLGAFPARRDACPAEPGGAADEAAGRSSLFSAVLATGRPLVVLADEDEAASDEEAVAAGAWDWLPKFTLRPPQLARSLRRGIEHARQHAIEQRCGEARKMDALSRLAGGMAHDFNNLLTAMLGYAEMLRESFEDDDARRLDVLEIQRAGERATALTRQLLAFAGRKGGSVAPLDLNAAIDRLRPSVAAAAGESVRLSVDPETNLAGVRIEEARLETVLAAIASNARDAMADGGVLRIETRNVHLDAPRLAAHPDAAPGPHVLLLVADEGTGLTAEARAHLFEPFFTTKGKGKGTGLGLAVVYGIVRQARGHIEVDSAGAGTTVRIYFPAG
jgi:signal transduction histidine kinase